MVYSLPSTLAHRIGPTPSSKETATMLAEMATHYISWNSTATTRKETWYYSPISRWLLDTTLEYIWRTTTNKSPYSTTGTTRTRKRWVGRLK